MSRLFFHLKKFCQRFQKSFKEELFFGVAAILTVFLFGILVFEPALKSLSLWDFSFLTATMKTKLSPQNLFVEPAKNFLRESPKMSFIQKNSIVGVSPPTTITPQVLGSMLGGIEGETEGRKEIVEHIVESGDTLSFIAAKYDVSLDTILWANDLNSRSIIKPGQKLIILPVSGVLYMVERNDTLSKIAETYKANLEEIVEFNELGNEGNIYIGDFLIIPNGKQPPIPSPTFVNDIPVGKSYFILPCEGMISQGLHPYNAIDIANDCGSLVVAAAGGTVEKVGRIKIGGNRVTILHPNGVVTYYGHLSAILVAAGQKVNAGDLIGRIGTTGYATGCHLHFDVLRTTTKNFLSKYPVGSFISRKN